MKTSRLLRCGVAAFGAAMLVAAGTAIAAADEYGDENIDVTVDIAEVTEPGVLALTVASNSTTLTESGSTDLQRQFVGTLPTVTVTDTRTSEEIADDAAWYVLGSASAFTHQTNASAPTIGAGHLGWEPALVGGDEGFISVGDDVQTVLDGAPGLVDQELLYLGESETAAAEGGAWSATANLFLRVAANVEPGSYASVLTLSLFE